MSPRWPTSLWVVRHGESAGNVARDIALCSNAEHIDVRGRDMDVPLSERGETQARALAQWFAALGEGRPDVVLTSPYLRARRTAELIKEGGGLAHSDVAAVTDERLREREFGVLDRLTSAGIATLHPDQAEARAAVGKFYYRPPGGESWCDVILRLRSVIDTINLHHAGHRVLIVAHQAVVLCLRYLLEGLDEGGVLAIDAQGDVANCSITEYGLAAGDRGPGGPILVRYNFVAPLADAGAPVTHEPAPQRATAHVGEL
jgi:probable phosphoglycerate mutase